MPFVSITPPPGVVKPGTRYEAKGRWYDTNFVRWHDGIMQPIGGWELLSRTASAAVAAAIADDGGAFTDETAAANEATSNDVTLLPATPAENDAYYFGFRFRFTELEITLDTAATDGAVTWEYYDGSSWTALSGVADATSATYGFDTTGSALLVSWTLPTDWAKTTINSQGPFFYVRARVSTAGTSTALAGRVWVRSGPLHLDEVVRGAHAWRTNANSPRIALGTPTYVYAFGAGTLTDITPAGFTTGAADISITGGNYGAGAYGAGLYGTGDPAQEALTEPQTYQMDNYGEDLVFVALSDGKLYYWDSSVGGAAAAVTNAPTGNVGVVVTPERFLMALGAGGDPRKIEFADQDDHTDWTATTANQAGDIDLPGSGAILAGHRAPKETLVWTDEGLFAIRYIGGEFVYRAESVGSDGAYSRRSMVVIGPGAMWMGREGFYLYDGYTRAIPSEITDYVFSDINESRASMVWAESRAAFGEVIWHYPSAGSTECDRAVVYNYTMGIWYPHVLGRTGGVDSGVFDYPIAVDGNGAVYRHDTGGAFQDFGDAIPAAEGTEAYAETGPMELGEGDQVMCATALIPDFDTSDDLTMYLYSSFYPLQSETLSGAYTTANRTDVRLTARTVRFRVVPTGTNAKWRLGDVRMEVAPGGQR